METVSNGVSRHSRHADDDDMRIEVIGPPQSPGEQIQSGHHRGISESQDLLSFSQRSSSESEVAKSFRYVVAPIPESSDYPQKEAPFETGIPQSLKQNCKRWFREIIFDLFLISVGFPFLALGVAVTLFKGKEVTQKSEIILNDCLKVSATLFPFIFSMVVGRTLVKLASRKLEQGATVGTLEQLMASRTVSSALITHFRIQPFSFFGFALILLWLFSPTGSQASLRMLSTTELDIISPSNVSYANTRQQSYSGNSFGSSWIGFQTLFSASILAPPAVKSGSTDLWHNVKIPYLSTLRDSSVDDEEWRLVPDSNSTLTYSSLFGIPISGLSVGTTDFTIDSTYIELACSDIAPATVRGENRTSSFRNPGLISTAGPFKSATNVTEETSWAIGYLGEDATSQLPEEPATRRACLDCLKERANGNTTYSGILVYQDFTGTKNVTSVFCSPSQVYVESRIQCNKTDETQSCAVTAQRKSQLSHPPSDITLLSFSEVFKAVSKLLPLATPATGVLDMLQNYLIEPLSNTYIQSNPYPYLDTSPSSSGESHVSEISLPDFSHRFGQVLNAFLYSSIFNATNLLTSENFDEMDSWTTKPDFIPAETLLDLYENIHKGIPALTVNGNTTTTKQVFSVSYPWLAVFMISASLLPLAALAAAVLNRNTISRDYLGFVSSLARESRYFDGEAGGAALDGMQRARFMRDVRVRLGDVGNVEGGHEIGTGVVVQVGRMAFGGRKMAKRLDRKKMYL